MPNKKLLHFLASLAIFMEMVDSTILNTAIPSMAHDLNVEPINLKIALISYLLMLAIFIPISGWVADKLGAKKVFIAAFSVFTISSFGCGWAHSLTELIIMRCFQGIGSAFLVPVARLLVVRSVERHEIVVVMGKVITIGSVGLMLGPVLGGLITQYFSWPWIFFVNIPIGIIAILLGIYKMENMPPLPVGKFDAVGFVLFGLGLASFIFGISAITESGWSRSYPIAAIIVSLIFLGAYFFHAHRIQHPVLNTRLLKINSFKISVLANIFTRMSFTSAPFLLPLFLQVGFNYSPTDSGLLFLPMALGIIVSKLFVAPVLKYLGYRRYLISNTLLVGVLMAIFGLLSAQTPWPVITVLTFFYGILTSQQFSGMNSLAYIELNNQQMSSATSFMGTLQQFSQSLGVALAAILLHVVAFGLSVSLMNPLTFKVVFGILGIFTLLSAIVFVGLQKSEYSPKVTPQN
jgi:EmrB/QacA subfamily drug resistance transporter